MKLFYAYPSYFLCFHLQNDVATRSDDENVNGGWERKKLSH